MISPTSKTCINLGAVKKAATTMVKKIGKYRGFGAKSNLIACGYKGGTAAEFVRVCSFDVIRSMVLERTFDIRDIPQELITEIASEISYEKGELPEEISPKRCDPRHVASIITKKVVEGKTASKIAEDLFNYWDIETPSKKLRKHLYKVVEDVEFRVAMDEVVKKLAEDVMSLLWLQALKGLPISSERQLPFIPILLWGISKRD